MDGRAPLSRRTLASRVTWGLIAAVPVLFLGYFFAYPLVTILITSLTSEGGTNAMVDVVTRRPLLGVAWFTTWQAIASTVLTVAIGLPGAYVLARIDFPGRKVVRALTIVPFVLPTVVVGTAFLALLGPRGIIGVDLSRTVTAIIVAHVFYNYAIVVRTVGTYWEHLDPRMEEAARTLGATRWQAFRRVTLPLLVPAIASAAAIVFLFTFTSFGVILILGGLEQATIEVEIWRQAVGVLNLPVAAALAVLQLLGIAMILTAYTRYQERRSHQLSVAPSAPRRPASRWDRWMVGGNLAVMGALLGGPLAVLVIRSLRTGSGYGLGSYTDLGSRLEGTGLFVPPATAIANSLRFAIAATLIAVVIGVLASAVVVYRSGRASRVFDTFLMLPLGTSAVTLGFGFLVALDTPVDLRTSLWLVPIAHALVAIPFVVRTTTPVMRRIRMRLREAAAVLGAGPLRTWREVDLPLIARAVAVGAGFAFAISLGEFGATSFIARPDAPTLPIAIFRLLGRPGALTFGRAMALSVILMVLTATAVIAIERFRIGHGEDF